MTLLKQVLFELLVGTGVYLFATLVLGWSCLGAWCLCFVVGAILGAIAYFTREGQQ